MENLAHLSAIDAPSVASIGQAPLAIPRETARQSMARAHCQWGPPVEMRAFSNLGTV